MATWSDNFGRDNENPLSGGGNWGQLYNVNQLQLLSTVCTRTVDLSDNASVWIANTPGNNQFSQITISQIGTDGQTGVYVRIGTRTTAQNHYYVQTMANWTSIEKFVSDNWYELTNIGTPAWTTGDTVKLDVTGSSPGTLTVYRNGTSCNSTTDSSHTAGQVGIHTFAPNSGTRPTLDNWTGGDIPAPSCALTGTITASTTEADIVAGGKTIILTLSDDTFIA